MQPAFVLVKDYQGSGSSPRGSQRSFSSADLEFRLFDLRQKPGKIYFFACAFTLVTFLVTFFVTLQEFKSRLRLVKVLTGEFLVNPCLKSYATFSSFLCFFNAPTTWNTAAIKILSLFKVGLMVYLFISDWRKRRIKERIPGSVPGDNEVFGPGNTVLGVKSILGESKIAARFCCLQDQSFSNFENDTMTLSVKEAKLTGLWAN